MGTNSSHCLFVIVVALVLANSAIGENEWSGFVNTFTTDFSYLCPDDLAVSGIASTFRFDSGGAFQGCGRHLTLYRSSFAVIQTMIVSGNSDAQVEEV